MVAKAIYFDSFTSLDDLSKRDRRDYEKVKAAILAAGRFSCFDAEIVGGDMLSRICRDPDLNTASVGYPWTRVVRIARSPIEPTPSNTEER